MAADASSASEVLFEQLNQDNVDKNTAECLYTGLIHDTGVFKYSCTSARTMEIAGFLMEKALTLEALLTTVSIENLCAEPDHGKSIA